MALALVSAAKIVLPALYDGYAKHEQIIMAAKQCETSLSKAEELLAMEEKLQNKTTVVETARMSVEACVRNLHKYLEKMSIATKEDNADVSESKSMVGKAMDFGAKVVSKVADATKTRIESLLVDRVAQLSRHNSDLLIACVDLSLAIQRIPQKSSFCTIS
jgi:hypothetical protein